MKLAMFKSKTRLLVTAVAMGGAITVLPVIGRADTSYTINNTVADAFLASGSPNNPAGTDLTGVNFGAVGTLAIAPASSAKGEFDSILEFNTAGAFNQFNVTYGAGNWAITGLTLSLASNFGGQGEQPASLIFNTINAGSFGIDWLPSNGWVEGSGGGTGTPGYPNNSSVSFNSIPILFSYGYDNLGTYSYVPPGDNVYMNYPLPLDSGLVSQLAAGGDVSLFFYAADDQIGYLFNSRSFSSNHPELTIIATAIPEPAATAQLVVALGSFLLIYHRGKKKMNHLRTLVLAMGILSFGSVARAQVTYTNTDDADAFLATGSPANPVGTNLTGLNFGGAGTLVIAPATSLKGEFQSIIGFSLSNAVALFNTNYGAGNWTITGISLQLASNYGTAGVQPNNAIFPVISAGNFVIEWLSTNGWPEGTGSPNLPSMDGVTYDSLPGLLSGPHEILCTNTYVPPGNNVPVTYALPLSTNLVTEILAGADATFRFYAADTQIGYLFNSYSSGHDNEPEIHITANLVRPEILSGYFTNSFFLVLGRGVASLQYQIQATSNLTANSWQVLGTVTADGTGAIQFEDTSVSNQLSRCYRLSH
jgi:hypothetical protein